MTPKRAAPPNGGDCKAGGLNPKRWGLPVAKVANAHDGLLGLVSPNFF